MVRVWHSMVVDRMFLTIQDWRKGVSAKKGDAARHTTCARIRVYVYIIYAHNIYCLPTGLMNEHVSSSTGFSHINVGTVIGEERKSDVCPKFLISVLIQLS